MHTGKSCPASIAHTAHTGKSQYSAYRYELQAIEAVSAYSIRLPLLQQSLSAYLSAYLVAPTYGYLFGSTYPVKMTGE